MHNQGWNKFFGIIIQDSPQLKIKRPQIDPILSWYTNTPTLTLTQGSCVNNEWTGDIASASVIKIKNTGGPFSGNFNFSCVLWLIIDVGTTFVATTISESVDVTINNLDTNGIYEFDIVNLPRFYSNNSPLILFTTNQYKIVMRSTQITNDTKETEIKDGVSTIYDVAVCEGDLIIGDCLDENSMITLYDGTEKQLKHLQIGERVLSYMIDNNLTEQHKWSGNIKNGEFTISTVKNIVKKRIKGYNVINDGLIKATPSHVMVAYIKSENIWKWTNVRNIKNGDKLFTQNSGIIDVESNIYLDAYMNIVRLDVEEVDNYFVNGVLNHNAESEMKQ